MRPGGSEVRLALLTPGSTEPDEISLVLDQPDSVKQALDRLQTPLVLTRGSLGATVIDVLDVKGAIVMEVDSGQAAAEAGLVPGDLVQQLDGQRSTRRSTWSPNWRRANRPSGRRGLRSVLAKPGLYPSVLSRVPALVTSSDRFQPAM